MTPPIVPVCWVDMWALSASLRTRLGLFEADDGRFMLRSGEEWGENWNAARNVVNRIRQQSVLRGHVLGDAYIYRVDYRSQGKWHEPRPLLVELQVAIVTNPQAFLFVGTTCHHLLTGVVVAVDRTQPTCAVNWGDGPRYHLILEFTRESKNENDQGAVE
jgi:hypothetical protein